MQDTKAPGAIVAGQRPGVDSSRCLACGAKRIDSQLGLESTPEEYVANLVAVFREVRRVLRKDGTVWLNLGDSYCGAPKGNPGDFGSIGQPNVTRVEKEGAYAKDWKQAGLKPKDLVGIPWRVAFALQADGWWLRSDIIWSKPNPMPESVTDRPTRAHEYLFLLTKSARYFYDADAIREPNAEGTSGWLKSSTEVEVHGNGETSQVPSGVQRVGRLDAGRNRRSVWEIATAPYPEAHFATFPPKLVEPCILAGSPPKCCGECGAPWERVVERKMVEGRKSGPGNRAALDDVSESSVFRTGMEPRTSTLGWRSTCAHDDDSGRPTVLDPFCGSGTTGVVALRHDRSFIGIDLSEEYCALARNRIREDAPLLNAPLEVAA